jgi:hypothetical protein
VSNSSMMSMMMWVIYDGHDDDVDADDDDDNEDDTIEYILYTEPYHVMILLPLAREVSRVLSRWKW